VLGAFAQRSQRLELLDQDDVPRTALWQNLRELETINTCLGGYRASLLGLERALSHPEQQWQVLDIGCGGGDTLVHMAAWGRKRGYVLKLLGADLKADCIVYARERCRLWPEIKLVQADFRDILAAERPQIVHAALFCHHLRDAEIVELLRTCYTSGATLIINDLERHPLAWSGIWALTRLLPSSYLVRHDAPLSVKRGFTQAHWHQLLAKADIPTYHLQAVWAFRHLLVIPPRE
jgi:2-polyprenyl-3-methyl-5-hydroxy-6-metoxy-1,4-benzoquinol methylase